MTPYTTRSGLRIGCNYIPSRRMYHDSYALMLQDALINPAPCGLIGRIMRRIWRML